MVKLYHAVALAYRSISGEMTLNREVMIIGGGIGGLALALFLNKAGIPSVVYEAFPYKEGVGGGLNLAPNGMKALAALDLAERTIAAGSLALEMCFRNERGKVLARFKNGTIEKYGQPSVSLTRGSIRGFESRAGSSRASNPI